MDFSKVLAYTPVTARTNSRVLRSANRAKGSSPSIAFLDDLNFDADLSAFSPTTDGITPCHADDIVSDKAQSSNSQAAKQIRWTDAEDECLKAVVDSLFESVNVGEEYESEDDDDSESGSVGKSSKSKKSKSTSQKRKSLVPKDKVRDVDWSKVAFLVGNGRKSAECLRRYNKIVGSSNAESAALKGPWTDEEDIKLMHLVTVNGPKKWSTIAAELPGKMICIYLIEKCF